MGLPWKPWLVSSESGALRKRVDKEGGEEGVSEGGVTSDVREPCKSEDIWNFASGDVLARRFRMRGRINVYSICVIYIKNIICTIEEDKLALSCLNIYIK